MEKKPIEVDAREFTKRLQERPSSAVKYVISCIFADCGITDKGVDKFYSWTIAFVKKHYQEELKTIAEAKESLEGEIDTSIDGDDACAVTFLVGQCMLQLNTAFVIIRAAILEQGMAEFNIK